MKNLLLLFTFSLFFSSISLGQTTRKEYDSTLAKTFGGDEYGMKMYVFVALKTGSYKPKDSIESNSLFMGHMGNIVKLAKEGKLIVSGPFGSNQINYRGLFILDVATVEEAKKMVQTDPAIKIGLFDVELIPWYGSAALPAYLPVHDKIQKLEF
jgi:uncharacterized protein